MTIVRPEPRSRPDAREAEPVPATIAEPAVPDPYVEPEPLHAAASPDAPATAAPPAPVVSASGVAPATHRAAERERAIAKHFDRQTAIVSPDPGLEEKRRRLAGQYQPPTHEPDKKIWENVEVDQLGRSVLRDGYCFAVLDDPNVTRRYQFETFDRYLVSCSYQLCEPTELSWVAELRERYFYLRYPDGIGPEPAILAQEAANLPR